MSKVAFQVLESFEYNKNILGVFIDLLQLVDEILESFEYNKYSLGIFIGLSKAFDTGDHPILLKKLQLYGVIDRNHSWFKKYLSKGNNSLK